MSASRYRHLVFAVAFLAWVSVLRCPAAELKKETVTAFDKYVKLPRAEWPTKLDQVAPFSIRIA